LKVLARRRLVATLLVLSAALAASVMVGLVSGPSSVTLREALSILFGDDASSPAAADIVLRIRLPRVLLAVLVGSSLSVAGVLFQALLRNPLADPYILGVSGGAALGGIVVLALGGSWGLGYAMVPPAAFAGSLLTLALLWLIGNLSAARTDVAGLVALFLVLGLACAIPLARGLNVLALGEESALQLGVNVERLRRVLLVATSLMVGAAVAVAGLVGFVGLIVPHLLRLVLGPDHRQLIPAAALAGGAFLVLCDVVARTLLPGRELPVGAVTALAGGPLFLVLLRRQGHRVFAP
jgi:iron complex transport system permease protein